MALIFVFIALPYQMKTANAQSDMYCTPMVSRPNAPRDLLPNQAVDGVPMTRHHIIPANMLIDFYNVTQRMSSQIGDSPVQQSIRHTIRNIFDSYYDLYTPYWGPVTEIRNAIANRLGFGQDDLSIILRMFVSWLPGNIFYGPTARLNDPHDQFDADAEYILGEANFRPIRSLHDRINEFNSNTDRSDYNFNRIVEGINKLASRPPTRANLNQWDKFYRKGGAEYYEIKKTNDNHQELKRRRDASDEQHLSLINEQPMCFIHTLAEKYKITLLT